MRWQMMIWWRSQLTSPDQTLKRFQAYKLLMHIVVSDFKDSCCLLRTTGGASWIQYDTKTSRCPGGWYQSYSCCPNWTWNNEERRNQKWLLEVTLRQIVKLRGILHSDNTITGKYPNKGLLSYWLTVCTIFKEWQDKFILNAYYIVVDHSWYLERP